MTAERRAASAQGALARVPSSATGLPRAQSPSDVGLSPERLGRITAAFQAEIASGAIPGAVILVARAGRTAYFEALGYRDREAQAAMSVDTVFRIASMTKPVTSVCAMMLAEEGRLSLAHPVSRYLPQFDHQQVGIESLDAATSKPMLSLVPVKREMTVQDLLRHTSGLTYGHFGDSLVNQAYRDARMLDFQQTNEELVEKLARLPLAYQPGSTWEYSLSTDVLGRVIEVVSGLPLDRFVAERVAAPLGLAATGFHRADAERLAQPQIDPATGKRPDLVDATQAHNWHSGGGGMISTAADYVRFAQMLLDGGEWEGRRLLSPTTVALMTCDHLPPGVHYGASTPTLFGAVAPTAELGHGFGLGFAVRKEPGRSPLPGSVGDYYWSGVTGTYFWVDPRQRLVAVLLTQAPAQRLHYRYLLRQLVYQAIVAPAPG